MKKRSIKELLIIMRDNEKLFHDLQSDGLCVLAYDLSVEGIISDKEADIVYDYINSNKPVRMGRYCRRYFWEAGEWPPRLKWLNEQIEKL